MAMDDMDAVNSPDFGFVIAPGILDAFNDCTRNLQWHARSQQQLQVGKQILKQMTCSTFSKGSFFEISAETTSEDALIMRTVFHLASVLCCVDPSASPFLNLMTTAETHLTAYIPAMPDDELAEILKTQGDVGIYKCPNGHPYVSSAFPLYTLPPPCNIYMAYLTGGACII